MTAGLLILAMFTLAFAMIAKRVSRTVVKGSDIVPFGALTTGARQLSFLAIRGKTGLQSAPFLDDTGISPGDMLICYGSDAAHEESEDGLSRLGWADQSSKL